LLCERYLMTRGETLVHMEFRGDEVTQAMREQIAALDADTFIHTTRTCCTGRCEIDNCHTNIHMGE
jgi:hypothetical protein